MSSYSKPNYRQPVEFIKQDHIELVESLRRWELKLAHMRNTTIEHLKCNYWSTAMDRFIYPDEVPQKLPILDETLFYLWSCLKNYYIYPEGYESIIRENKHECLNIDYDNFYDGFWERDPTWDYDTHKAKT